MNKEMQRRMIENLKASLAEDARKLAELEKVFALSKPDFTEYGEVPPPDLLSRIGLNRQEKYWRTKDGRWVSLSKMDAKHRENLLAHLERNAEGWQRQWLSQAIEELESAQYGDFRGPVSDGVWEGLEIEKRQLEEEQKVDPHVFLHRQPLWRRLAYDYLMSLDSWTVEQKKA